MTLDEALAGRLRGLARAPGPLLIASDLDGTLAPIVAHPEDARVPPATLAALERLARRLVEHVGQRQLGIVAPERRLRGRLPGYSSTPASSRRRTSASDIPRYSPSTSTLWAPKTGEGRRRVGGASERLQALPLSSSSPG